MKIGDIVKRKEWCELQRFVNGFDINDIGIIIELPDNAGDVVDIMVRGKKIRYWINGIEVISEDRRSC